MKASRTRIGLVWLTFVAFSVQLAVAVLHHHPGHAPNFEARAVTAGLRTASDQRPCDHNHQHGNDGCVLCWAAAIAASSLTPPVIELPRPPTFVATRLGTFSVQMVTLVHRDPVRARGPPSAIAA